MSHERFPRPILDSTFLWFHFRSRQSKPPPFSGPHARLPSCRRSMPTDSSTARAAHRSTPWGRSSSKRASRRPSAARRTRSPRPRARPRPLGRPRPRAPPCLTPPRNRTGQEGGLLHFGRQQPSSVVNSVSSLKHLRTNNMLTAFKHHPPSIRFRHIPFPSRPPDRQYGPKRSPKEGMGVVIVEDAGL